MNKPNRLVYMDQPMGLVHTVAMIRQAIHAFNKQPKPETQSHNAFANHTGAHGHSYCGGSMTHSTTITIYIYGKKAGFHSTAACACTYKLNVVCPMDDNKSPTKVKSIDIGHRGDGTSTVDIILDGALTVDIFTDKVLKPIYEYRMKKPYPTFIAPITQPTQESKS